MYFVRPQPSVDLGGDWTFAFKEGPCVERFRNLAEVRRAGLDLRPCVVPGNFELDLQAHGLIAEPFFGLNALELRKYENYHVWYARSFKAQLPADSVAQLVFDGLDCYADVFLNGQHIGSCENMLVEQVFDVTALLRPENELLVHIRPVAEAARQYEYPAGAAAFGMNNDGLYVRKAPHVFGWDIMPRAVSAGIWRKVRLVYLPNERIDEVYLETLHLAPDHAQAELNLHYRLRTLPCMKAQYELRLEAECGDARFEETIPVRFEAGHAKLKVDRPRLWWPRGYGRPELYQVRVDLLKDGRRIDAVSFTHGIRTVELRRSNVTSPAGEGEFCFLINGRKVFAKGSNWVPADAFHSRDVERIPAMLELAEEVGCNILRCWGGNVYEHDLFFEICDRKGIMIWQDFAMACAVYPQDEAFCRRLEAEAEKVIRRLRQHACLVLWAGDNECDWSYKWFNKGDPNHNVLTRRVLPEALRRHDPNRPFLPSSPYISPEAFKTEDRFLPENHLWGPRDYFKGDFYMGALCHFASEIGYHACPNADSLRKFISPERLWPWQDNPEWQLHSTSPDLKIYNYRVDLMGKQIRALFGHVPEQQADFIFASQATQAEALKFFIEHFRGSKWRRSGIIWWNLIDGWPQLSDAIVDYYFARKLAFGFVQRTQQDLLVLLQEPAELRQQLVATNDTLKQLELEYEVRDVGTGEILAEGRGLAAANAVTPLTHIPYDPGTQRLYAIAWRSAGHDGRSHYLAGRPPFDLAQYRQWLTQAGLV